MIRLSASRRILPSRLILARAYFKFRFRFSIEYHPYHVAHRSGIMIRNVNVRERGEGEGERNRRDRNGWIRLAIFRPRRLRGKVARERRIAATWNSIDDNYATGKFTASRNKSRAAGCHRRVRSLAVHKLRINELPMFAARDGEDPVK